MLQRNMGDKVNFLYLFQFYISHWLTVGNSLLKKKQRKKATKPSAESNQAESPGRAGEEIKLRQRWIDRQEESPRTLKF